MGVDPVDHGRGFRSDRGCGRGAVGFGAEVEMTEDRWLSGAARERLIRDACEAVELFGEDELERYAEGMQRRKDREGEPG